MRRRYAGVWTSGSVFAGALLLACANLDGLAGGELVGGGPGGAEGGAASDGGTVVAGGVVVVGQISIAPTSVDFQRAPCGTTQTATISLLNAADTATPYSLTLAGSATFALEGADANGSVTGDVPAHGQASITVKATGTTAGQDSTDVAAQVAGSTTTISVSLETQGGTLTFDPATVDFGAVRPNIASAQVPVTMRNDGPDPITITSFSGADDFATPTGVLIGAGSSFTGELSMKAGAAGAQITESATPVVVGQLCGAPPSLALMGSRVNTSVTVNPGSLDFGTPSCGSPATGLTKLVTISNYATAAIPYSLSLAATSTFTLPSTTSGTVPAATNMQTPGTVTIPIGIASVGSTPGDITDTLTVSYTPADGVIAVTPVTLHVRVSGAVVSLGQTSVDVKNGTSTNVPISNTGNVALCVHYASDNEQVLVEADAADTLAPDDRTQALTVSFINNVKDSDDAGSVTVSAVTCKGASAPAAVCGAIPRLSVIGDLN